MLEAGLVLTTFLHHPGLIRDLRRGNVPPDAGARAAPAARAVPHLQQVANHEARVVKHNLLQDWDDTDALMPSNHRYVPSAVFTDPQIASVGLTENQARAKGLNIKVKIQDFGDVAYGWAMEDTTGIAKVIVDEDTGLILGAHIMGHQASSLIQPLIQAMAFDLPAQDMARGQYWIHPALPEVVENALLALCGEPPWPPSKRH
jgi:mycothione reductase